MASDADPDAPAAGQRGRRSSGKTLTELSQVDDCNDPKMLARWTNNWSGPREGPLFEALEQRKVALLAERSLTRRVKDQPKSPGPTRWNPTEKKVRERTANKYGFRRNGSEVQRVGDSFPALLINPQPRPFNPKPRRRFARRLQENALARLEDDEILPAETKEIDRSLGLSEEDNAGASAKKAKRDDTPSVQIPPLDAAGSSVVSEAAEIPPGSPPGAAPRATFASGSSNGGVHAPDAALLHAPCEAALPSAGARGGPDALELAAPALKKQPSLAGMAAAIEETETPLAIAPLSPKEASFKYLKKHNPSPEEFKKTFNYDETEEPFAEGGEMRVHSVIGPDEKKFVVCKSIQKLFPEAKQRILNGLDILTELAERHPPGFLGLDDWCIEKKPEGDYILVASLQSGNDLFQYREDQKSKSDEEIEHLVRLVARQLIKSVDIMEDAGILHRDLKCENLLYSGDDNWKSGTANSVKIIDPGLAIRTADIRSQEDGLDPTRGGTAGFLSTSAWYDPFGIGTDREPAAMTLIQLAINDHPFINEIKDIRGLFARKIKDNAVEWIAKIKEARLPQSADLFAEEMIVLANEAGILPASLNMINFPGAAEFLQLVEELCCFCIEKRLSISAIQKLPFLTNDSEMKISNLVLQEQVSFDWTLGKGRPQEHCIVPVDPDEHQDAKRKITSIIDERVQDGDVRKQLADRIDGIFAIAIEASSRRKSASASPAVNEKRNAAVDRLLHFEVISVDEADDIKNRF